MVKENDSNKLEITYKEKTYEIEKIKDEQKVKPKGGKDTDKEITVKDYEEGGYFTSHKCKCSEDGTNFETVDIKGGTKKQATILSLTAIFVMIIVFVGGYFWSKKVDEEEEK